MFTHLIIPSKHLKWDKCTCRLMHAQNHDIFTMWRPSSLMDSHLSIGVFQRCFLRPPPENEIWPLLQHASCKLLLMHPCVRLCVCCTGCTLHVFANCSVLLLVLPLSSFMFLSHIMCYICFYHLFTLLSHIDTQFSHKHAVEIKYLCAQILLMLFK